MSTQVVGYLSKAPAIPKPAAGSGRVRMWMALAAVAALTLVVAAYGLDYYRLELGGRAFSAKHAVLKPGGTVGRALGVLGACLFVLIYLHPLRKRWPRLATTAAPRDWLELHILCGLAAPVVITFHSSFKLGGIVGVAYWIMISVIASGVIGRYLYGQIPRRLDAAAMSLQEIEAAGALLRGQLKEQSAIVPAGLEALSGCVPRIHEVPRMNLLRVFWLLVYLDLKRLFLTWKLWCKLGAALTATEEVREAFRAVQRQAALSKKVLFLSRTQRLFQLWHVVHRPFSYTLVVIAAMHIIVVLLLGY